MKVLIVDDSRGMRMMIRRAIRQAGFGNLTFEDAANGQEGLEKYDSFVPDIILSDWNMPVMDGMDFLKAVRKKNVGVRFGFVTSQATLVMKQEAKKAGALFLISKPFTPDNFKDHLDPYLS